MDRNMLNNVSVLDISVAQNRAARNINARRESVLRKYKINSPEYFVLCYVAEREQGAKVGEIAEALDVASTYVTGILRKLEAKHLTESHTPQTDRRVRWIMPTKKGAATATAVEQKLAESEHFWLGKTPPRTLENYLSVVNTLAAVHLKQ